MSRALSRSLAVVALLAVVSATLVVVTPSLARIADGEQPRHTHSPSWVWQSHVYGGETGKAPAATPDDKALARGPRRPYKPPVDR
jgi:hypothetical protein